MSRVKVQVRNAGAVRAAIKKFGQETEKRVQGAVARSEDRAYNMAQSLAAEETGETKGKMRRTIAPDGLSYEVGYYPADFPPGDFVPVFNEFGTSDTAAQPSIRPTAKVERRRFKRELREELKPR